MGKVAAYARVSTQEQAENQNALKQQISCLEDSGYDQLFCDVETGTSNDRQQFSELIQAIKRGDFEVVKATRVDRLLRNDKSRFDLENAIKASGTTLHLVNQGGVVDFDTAVGHLQFDMTAMMAAYEVRMLRERVQKGHEYRRKNKEGWSRQPFGYTLAAKQYVRDVRPILCLLKHRPVNYLDLSFETDFTKLPGLSKSKIAREAIELLMKIRRPRAVLQKLYNDYGVPHKAKANPALTDELALWNNSSSFREWILNPVLRGHTAYLKSARRGNKRTTKPESEWEVHPNTHPSQALMSEQEFDEILSILALNSKKVPSTHSTFYLTGLVICHECGHPCVLKRATQHRYYGCRYSGLGCSNRKNVRVEALDKAIIGAIFEQALVLYTGDGEMLTPSETTDVRALRDQLEGLDALLQQSPNAALKQARHDLQRQLDEITNPDRTLAFDHATAAAIIRHPQARQLAFWYTAPQDVRATVYDKLVQQVAIDATGSITAVDLKV